MKTLLAVDFGGYKVNYTGDVTGFLWGGKDIGAIISRLLDYVFPLAGLVLLFFLINGGFDLMTSAGDPKKMEVGKEKITAALVGFIIIFTAFWIYQIVKYILGIQ